jgi:hypothetical protein
VSQRNSGYVRQPNETYQTPPWVVRVLLPYLPRRNCAFIWDPAGPGTQIADTLIAAGYGATVTDNDFLTTTRPPHDRINAIITNPPFGTGGTLAVRFIEHATELVPFVAMLTRIDFDSGKTRVHLFRDHPDFAGKIVLLDRIVWFAREGAPGPSENHCWMLWDRWHGGEPTIRYAARPAEHTPRRQRRSGEHQHRQSRPEDVLGGVLRRFADWQLRFLRTQETRPDDSGES